MIKRRPIDFLLLSMLLVLSNCTCRDDFLTIQTIVIQFPPAIGSLKDQVDQQKLSAIVERAVQSDGNFRYAPEKEGSVLRLTFIPAPRDADASVMVVATIVGKKREHRAFADITMEDGVMLGKDVSAALQKVLAKLFALERGQMADNQEYIDRINAWLIGEKVDHGSLINAVSALASASSPEGIKALVSLLKRTDDIAVGNACVIALADLKAPEAMPAIIDFVERKPPLIRRQGILAARRIASRLAAEWLFVMAYGHEDPTVRREAKEALIEVEHKLGIEP